MSVPSEPIIFKRPFTLSNRVELYWQPPISNGGNVITSYILESSNIPYIEILPPTATKSIVDNLINGNEYVFTIKATNINGNGSVAVYNTVQTGFKPLNPTNLNFSSNIDKIQFTFNNTTDIGNSKILFNVVTMLPVDVTGNVLETSSLKYFVSARESNIVNPVSINKINTNYDFKAFVRARNSINFSDRGNADFIVNPNLPTNGLKLWLDPYDMTTITLSNSKVTRWQDKSRNRSNATVNELFAPTYDSNVDVMVFNGSQYLNLPANTLPSGNTSYTIFTYVSTSNISRNNQWLLYSGTPSPNLSLASVINNGSITQSWNGSQLISNSNISASISYLLEMTYDNGIRRTLINGNLIAQDLVSTRNSTTGNNIIGSNSTLNANLVGTIGDIIIYDRLLNNIERNLVKNYLERKKFTLSLQNMGNLVVWLDPSDNNTLYDANIKTKIDYNSNVYTWLDKSGNNNNARQSNISVLPTRRPYIQNNLDVLEFNQSYLTIPSAYYPLDTFMVLKLDNLSSTYGVLGIGPNSNNYSSLSYNTSGGNLWSINNSNSSIISGNIETSGNFLLMEWSIGNNNNVIRRFGSNISNVTTGTFTLPNNSNIIIGNNNGFDFSKRFKGYIGELIMFNRQLIDSDRQQIEGYLSWKWGLQSFLPSNHPFKNSAPYLFNKFTTGAFSPLSISNLALWLDADDSTTLSLSGNYVLQWNDKSGSGLNVTSPVSIPTSPTSSGSYNYFVLFVYGGYGQVGLKNLTFYGSSGALVPQTYTVANVTSASQLTQIASTDNFYIYGSTLLTKRVSTASAIGATFTNTTPGFPINNSGDSTFLDFLPFYISTPITPTSVSFGCYDPNSGSGDGLYRCKYFRLYGGTSIGGAMPDYLFNLAQYGNPNSVQADNAGYANFAQIPTSGSTIPIPTYNTNILNSKPVVNFTVGQFLQTQNLNPASTFTTFNTDTTIFLITRMNGDGINNLTSFGLNTTDNNFVLRAPWSNANKILDIGARLDFNNNLNNQIVLFSMGRNGSNMFLYNNGSLIGSISNASLSSTVTTLTQKLLIGSGLSNSYDGYIAEFLIYKTALSTLDRQKIEGYLAWKWGLQQSLYSTHPYKNEAPYLITRPITESSSNLPATIPGLLLWLDANDDSTIIKSGFNVTQWRDKSTSSNHFTAYGAPIQSIDANNKTIYIPRGSYLNGPNTVSLTTSTRVLAVSRCITTSGDFEYVFNLMDVSDKSVRYWNSQPKIIGGSFSYYSDSNDMLGSSISINAKRESSAITAAETVSTMHMWDGNFYTNFTSRLQISLSSGRTFEGHICEILVYNSLSNTDYQLLQGYLAWKWGLNIKLPITHPYKEVSPISVPSKAPTFSPTSLSGLHFWIDISNRSSLTFSGGSRTIGSTNYDIVTQVNDLSGNNRHMTVRVGAGAAGPVYFSTFDNNLVANCGSYSAINFGAFYPFDYPGLIFRGRWNSTLDSLTCNLNLEGTSLPMTIFIVSRDYHDGCLFGSTDNSYYFIHYSDIYDLAWMPGYQFDVRGQSKSNYKWVFESICYTGASGRAQILYNLNGTQIGNNLNTSGGGYYGLNNFIINGRTNGETTSGTVHEVLVYTSVLKFAEIRVVEGYMAWKWGLASNLPIDHPFKFVAPSSNLSYFTFEFLAQNYSSSTWTNTGNTGTLGEYYKLIPYNSITTSSDVYGTFLNFNGSNQYLQLPAKITFNFNNYEGFTYICIAKFNSNNNFERFFDFGNGQTNNNILFTRQSTNSSAYLEIWNSGTSLGIQVTPANYIDSNWHIYGCTISLSASGTNYKIFRDNINSYWLDTTSATIPSNRTTSLNYIARSHWSADSYFNGNIRYVNFLTSNLSSTDLANLLTSLRSQYGIA